MSMQNVPDPAFVIYINGWPGVGKLTVAKALQSKIAGSQILHNHELIDPVEKHYPRTCSEYAHQRALYRRTRLAEIATQPRTVYVFTDAQTEYNTCVDDYMQLTRPPHNRRFYSAVLQCELSENLLRLKSAGRDQHSTGKLTDTGVLQGFRATMEIYEFGNDDEIVVDVTKLSADQVAGRIVEFVRSREAHKGFPSKEILACHGNPQEYTVAQI